MKGKRILWTLAALSSPVAGFYVYELVSPLPPSLQDKNLSVLSRIYVRRGLLCKDIDETAQYFDEAMKHTLNTGVGAASPQATALIVYLARLFLNHPEKSLQLQTLDAIFEALVKKPHIGEGLREEIERLQLALKYAVHICNLAHKEEKKEIMKKYASWGLGCIDKPPSYFPSWWKNQEQYKLFFRNNIE